MRCALFSFSSSCLHEVAAPRSVAVGADAAMLAVVRAAADGAVVVILCLNKRAGWPAAEIAISAWVNIVVKYHRRLLLGSFAPVPRALVFVVMYILAYYDSVVNRQYTDIQQVVDNWSGLCYYLIMDIQEQIKLLIERDRRDTEIVRLRDEGWTLQKIADKFGLRKQRVWAILKRENQPKPEK
jgi:hypothetical protein